MAKHTSARKLRHVFPLDIDKAREKGAAWSATGRMTYDNAFNGVCDQLPMSRSVDDEYPTLRGAAEADCLERMDREGCDGYRDFFTTDNKTTPLRVPNLEYACKNFNLRVTSYSRGRNIEKDLRADYYTQTVSHGEGTDRKTWFVGWATREDMIAKATYNSEFNVWELPISDLRDPNDYYDIYSALGPRR